MSWDPLASEEAWGGAGEDYGDGAPHVSIGTAFQVVLIVLEDAIEGVDNSEAVTLDDNWEACCTDDLQKGPSPGFVGSLHQPTEGC